LSGLYPKDDLDAFLVDEVLGITADILAATLPGLFEQDEEKKVSSSE